MSVAPWSARAGATDAAAEGACEVVLFAVGKLHFAVARGSVRSLRPSPRLRSVLGGSPLTGLPLVSMSTVLGIERDTSVDRRVLEVVHWGERLGLEVTGIAGIRRVGPSQLFPLPRLVAQCVRSRNVLGLAELGPVRAVVLDLAGLLVERGVEIPTAR